MYNKRTTQNLARAQRSKASQIKKMINNSEEVYLVDSFFTNYRPFAGYLKTEDIFRL